MQPKTEELLNFLLWTAEKLARPTFRNLTDSYESWAYRRGLMRQVRLLVQDGLVEGKSANRTERLYRLTEKGRLHVLGGRDPEIEWARPWDGQWRLVVFDVPVEANARRNRLRRYLQGRGFGRLQDSVWVTPHATDQEREILAGGEVDVGSLILLEARPGADESDAEIVAAAWKFTRINMRYERHLKVLEQCPLTSLQDEKAILNLQCWACEERTAWLDAVSNDPLLPFCLLPKGYLGQQAWSERIKVLAEAGNLFRT